MRASVILAAGGAGTRLGAALPKALVPLAGKPLFLYSLELFAAIPFVREIVLVLPEPWVERVARKHGKLLRERKVIKIVPGGRRRQDSVLCGLRVSDPRNRVVLVHDAARPFAPPGMIRRVATAAQHHGAAVPVVPISDTLKVLDARGLVVETPRRDRLRAAQTPQGFRREVLLEAYRRAGRREVTDDVQLVERVAGRVAAVDGDVGNFKVTTPEDLRRAVERVRTFPK